MLWENKERDLPIQPEGYQAELWYIFAHFYLKMITGGWGEGCERENLDNEKYVLKIL